MASQNDSNKIGESQKAPLVDELFKPQYWTYAEQLGFSGSDLIEYHNLVVSGNSLEQLLTDKWEAILRKKNNMTIDAERKDFGRITFYVWWLLQNVSKTYTDGNLYKTFLKKLKDQDEQFGIINFNYDTLLDRALQNVYGRNFLQIADYQNYNYIKPHGSVNWFIPKRPNDPVLHHGEESSDIKSRVELASSRLFFDIIEMSETVVWFPSHTDLNSLNIFSSQRFKGQYCYPLVLLPLTNKMYQQFVGFREKIITAAQNLVAAATEIFLVGYRAEDEVIKEIFETVKLNTPLYVVNRGDETRKIRNEVLTWKRELKSTKGWDTGFAGFIEDYFKT